MEWFSFVKRQYDLENYTAEQVGLFVEAKKITDEEAKKITSVLDTLEETKE